INPISNSGPGGNTPTGGGTGTPTGTGGDDSFAPGPVSGNYEIDIDAGNGSNEGSISFTIESDGSIGDDVIFTDETTDEQGPLSPDLYETDDTNSGLILKDTPPEYSCASQLKVSMGDPLVAPFVLALGAENIEISGIPAGIDNLTVEVFDKNGNLVFSNSLVVASSSISVTPSGVPEGPCSFRITLLTSGGSEFLKGQFIAKM
ncbi:MAG: hypothetical protein AAB316_13610, partial [Bacteroidota bacterium]